MGRGSATILIVEDDNDIRLLLRTVLEAEGYRIVEAVTGKDAVSTGAEEDDIDGLLRSADREMYGDKRGGRSKPGIRAS